MKKTFLTFAAVAAISGAIGTYAHAQDVKVKNGDTLWGLSQKYHVSIDELKSLNNLTSDTIQPEDVLNVSSKEYYSIKSGDTLWHIANKFHVSVENLKAWNHLNSDLIQPNQKLSVSSNGITAASEPKHANRASVKQEAQPTQEKSEPAQPQTKAASSNEKSDAPAQKQFAKELTVASTGYTASCKGCSGVTATGVDLKANPEAKVIAVDPSVIPLGSQVYVEGYGYATAEDIGGGIKGNEIDIFFPKEQDALNWGRKQVQVKVIK
ncbi:LysM peptidoglycan-binding domain-containing protein [Actinomycetes bacterium NPDC127524]